ncbi:peptide MFS transporter [Xanthomonas translucens]|uniref:peptide MFS transporter n=3 Tax=Xanthomonas campestris pv. translucens TaxID=343 RepID=UPI0006420FAB|nr:oligopeptide:H+ symporter [Xanthomonas translucens]AKK69240.1 dihydroorotate dehydrogenase [Xanthomonas translucens pv. undulosa]MCT8271476.1 oligopeptide:H+ symporter [Xanthomonas translucens pv. undulosa]QEN95083.1 MFS transporter [Xanthomonas translucens pv. undulosa]QSQ42339.1 MFS transporter [Xanthomonas translucens pv. translucens]QSQ49814.1 MFS transporter [Xanthomonas translucens pv. undulosa]
MSVDDVASHPPASPPQPPAQPPEFKTLLGHPRPLWLLFMTEFWERFAFYGIRWALTLYIVAEFFQGSGAGEAPANRLYGAYLALVYASALFGGFVADRLIGYQRSLLIGAVFMSVGLFLIAMPNQEVFKIGLATIIAGNGLFKPNVSTMVGKLYPLNDPRRDSGFTIFYMGINAGGLVAPILTGLLADKLFGSEAMPAYKYVFIASGIGMLISLVWFWIGRHQLGAVGRPPAGGEGMGRTIGVLLATLVVIPVAYGLLLIDAGILGWILTALFVALCALILVEGIREGRVPRDRSIAMLIVFVFNVMFFMFFEQAGSSFNFLAQNIVERDLGGWIFPVGWFQSVNTLAILVLGPVFVWLWVALKSSNPSIPRKFGLGLIFNGLAFALLMYALSSLVDGAGKIPFWTLFMVYVIQTVGELCLSPIGLSMTTKLAPTKVVGFAMGGWFLSTAIGNNLSGIFAAGVSGETGMTVDSALKGYTFGFWALLGSGVLLFLIAPLINKLMHGVK